MTSSLPSRPAILVLTPEEHTALGDLAVLGLDVPTDARAAALAPILQALEPLRHKITQLRQAPTPEPGIPALVVTCRQLGHLAEGHPEALPDAALSFSASLLDQLTSIMSPEARAAWGIVFAELQQPMPLPPVAGEAALHKLKLNANAIRLTVCGGKLVGAEPAEVQGLGVLVEQIERIRQVVRGGGELDADDVRALQNMGEILIDYAASQQRFLSALSGQPADAGDEASDQPAEAAPAPASVGRATVAAGRSQAEVQQTLERLAEGPGPLDRAALVARQIVRQEKPHEDLILLLCSLLCAAGRAQSPEAESMQRGCWSMRDTDRMDLDRADLIVGALLLIQREALAARPSEPGIPASSDAPVGGEDSHLAEGPGLITRRA